MSDQMESYEITNDDKLWALLSWLFAPIIPIVVLLMDEKKARPFIKYNAILGLAWSIVYYVIGGLLSMLGIGFCLIGLAWIATIFWGIQAYQSKIVKIPVLSDFIKNQGWI